MAKYQTPRKVVVTGIGVVTALGQTLDTFWASLLAGRSGISPIKSFDVTDFPCKIGGEIHDFDPTKFGMDPKEARRNDRYTQLGFAAAKLAMQDSGLDPTTVDRERAGVIIGSGIGGMSTFETQARTIIEKGPRKVSPFFIPAMISNMASGIVAIEFNFAGPCFTVVSACATSTHALGEAMRTIQYGDADVMVAGGAEASVTPLSFAGFCSMKAMSTNNDNPEKASRPFDANRDGFVMGEGGCVFILESEEYARARGARIYCELAGYAATADAFHITQPDPDARGLASAMRRALADAGVTAAEVNYINAHGTSTPYNDKFETIAIKKVFGDSAKSVAVSSTKSMTGHLLGAAGAVEAAVCVMAIKTGEIPPTINYETPDPECDLDYVPNVKRSAKVDVAMSNNLGFGGQNASIVFKRL
jgi:3-oxoacyl-[acyl-carrier-protein] synthase II